jgi:hypothetical protein
VLVNIIGRCLYLDCYLGWTRLSDPFAVNLVFMGFLAVDSMMNFRCFVGTLKARNFLEVHQTKKPRKGSYLVANIISQ